MKRWHLSLVLIAAAAAFAAPAAAADPDQIGCPADTLSGADRERLVEHVRHQGQPTEPAMQVFYRSVDGCVARHGWSAGAARQAIVYNLAFIGQRETRATLQQRGVDVAEIERRLLADAGTIAASRTDSAPEALLAFYNRLDPAMRERLEADARGDTAELLGSFLMFRAAVETSRADFAAQ
ncbi:MAG: hypothetical protein QOI38_1576 [Sphingomonadales bacterium]|jgi:hypothetical protein|nr:hypothetical protein [Sphingomonadales bacterium]